MNNQLKATIITKNSKDSTLLTAKQGELVVDYTAENKPTIKVGPAAEHKPTIKVGPAGASSEPATPIDIYAKCEQITDNNGVKISETGDSTFGNMKSTANGIKAEGKNLTDLGVLTLREGSSYGTSLPQGTEGQVFFLIQSK